jgi:Domain of unknown function (DUF1816)
MKHLLDWFKSHRVRQLMTTLAPDDRPSVVDHRQTQQLWWVEVQTSVPRCTYYFGPFDHQDEARASREGYVQDLEGEGARDIVVLVKQCQPNALTIDQGYYSATGQQQQI